MFNNIFFPENRIVYQIMWINTVERGRPQMTIWRMRIACWIPKETLTDSEYIILLACPLQQWSHERAQIFHYTYGGSLVLCCCGDDVSNIHGRFRPHQMLLAKLRLRILGNFSQFTSHLTPLERTQLRVPPTLH